MREIEFRAWDVKHKRFLFQNIHIDGTGCVSWACGYDCRPVLRDEYAIEQFTGLRDKNGEKIFEGDVLRSDGGHIHVVVWGPRIQARVVRKVGPHWPAQYLDCNYMNWEVVGNIHQNPELLEAIDEK